MPFGKYRSTPLSELPGAYVDWLGEKLSEWREPFRSALAAELERRKGTSRQSEGGVTTPPRRSRAKGRQHHAPPEPGVVATCDVCGLRPTAERPLVHADCVHNGVPF
jgi:putative quorum-sensing-regulated virulence factor